MQEKTLDVIQTLNDGDDSHEMLSKHEIEKLIEEGGIVMMLLLLVTYVAVGSYMEKKKFKFGHETGAIILIGSLVSVIIWLIAKKIANKVHDNPQFYPFIIPDG